MYGNLFFAFFILSLPLPDFPSFPLVLLKIPNHRKLWKIPTLLSECFQWNPCKTADSARKCLATKYINIKCKVGWGGRGGFVVVTPVHSSCFLPLQNCCLPPSSSQSNPKFIFQIHFKIWILGLFTSIWRWI